MKLLKTFLLFLLATVIYPIGVNGQNLSITGQTSFETLLSSSNRQPFYFWANQLGQVSALEQYNLFTHVSSSANYQLPNKNQSFFAGVNVNLKKTQNVTFNLPELYGGFKAKYFIITGGLFADSVQMAGLSPSNGNFMVTRNAKPHPRLRLGSNKYIRLGKNNLFIAGIFEEGVLNDTRWVNKARLHHKNLYFRAGNPATIQITAGLDHFVFWGGATANESYDASLKDYIQTIFAGRYYAEKIEMRNTIGNQLGQYQVHLKKSFQNVSGTFQISHMFEDQSGLNLMNYPDNIYTLLLELHQSALIKKVLVEYTYTKHQSGPTTDPKTGAYRPSGADNYFSHSQYRSGFTYEGYFIGNPLFGPLKYTEDGIPNGPANNRFSAIHLGIAGELSSTIEYRLMATHSKNYGRYSAPYQPTRHQLFSMVELKYSNPKFQNIVAAVQFGFDRGALWTGSRMHEGAINLKLCYLLN